MRKLLPLTILVAAALSGCSNGTPLTAGQVPPEAGLANATRATEHATINSEREIREIIQNETDAWNRKDAVAYSRDFAQDGLFTNILGQFFTGYDAFLRQHEFIFRGPFLNTTLQQDIEALTFPTPNVALVVTLSAVSGLTQMPVGATPDGQGRLRTRLLQVILRDGSQWKIAAYHNVDVTRVVPVPEPGGN